MMTKFYRVFSLVLILLLVQSPALAWNSVEHVIINQIAYSRLNPTAKARVTQLAALLRFHNLRYTPVTMGLYMDDVRADPYYDSLRSWHYIDKPFYDGVSPTRGAELADSEKKQDAEPPSLLTQIPEVVKFLREQAASPSPVSAKGSLKEAQYLAFLSHVVGDAHQPFHCVTRYTESLPKGDAGGNRFLLKGEFHNLHSFWDQAGGLYKDNLSLYQRQFTPVDQSTIQRYASAAMDAYPPNDPIVYPDYTSGWQNADVKIWIEDSYQIAVRFGYKTREGAEPSKPYTAETQKICQALIVKAGYRLAAQINDIYREPNQRPKSTRR
jgi:hypothetical protein